MSLIDTLNRWKTLQPDEIARRLTSKGWRKPSELGREYFETNKHLREFVYCQVYSDGRVGAHNLSDRAWPMANCSPNYARFVDSLEGSVYPSGSCYWIIHNSEYTGELPPCSRP